MKTDIIIVVVVTVTIKVILVAVAVEAIIILEIETIVDPIEETNQDIEVIIALTATEVTTVLTLVKVVKSNDMKLARSLLHVVKIPRRVLLAVLPQFQVY